MVPPAGSGEAQTVRIVIADEQPIFRDGLRRLLETDPALLIAGEAGDSAQAVTLVQQLQPDILLLSLVPSDGCALKALQDIAALQNPVRTILLTANVDTPDVMEALQLGVRGVVPKDSAADVLFKSIHSVTAGDYWIGDAGVSDVVASWRELTAARRRSMAFGLTQRELEIVRAVVAGSTNKEIAKRFDISENTVKRHLSHIFDKLGTSNRLELALFAAYHRLLGGV